MCNYFRSKAMPAGRNGYARTFHAETGHVFYRFRKGSTSVGASFSLAELTNPIMRINTARKLRMLRAVL
jgi:hypothetical protein